MRNKAPLLGAIALIALIAACSDSPVGVERFDPQFDSHVTPDADDSNKLTYNFAICPTNGVYSGGEHPDLLFDGWDAAGGCLGGALTILVTGRDFSIGFEAASEVSIETDGFPGTLVAFDEFDAQCPAPLATVTTPVILTAGCGGRKIEKIQLFSSTPFGNSIFDNLTITYIGGDEETDSPLKAKAKLKRERHTESDFRVEATCSEGSTLTSATLNGIDVVNDQIVTLPSEDFPSLTTSHKSAKHKYTLEVTCSLNGQSVTKKKKLTLKDKSGKSDKSKGKSKKGKSRKG